MRLPGRSAAEEQTLDLLEGFPSRFGEQEEDVDAHDGTEDAKEDVDLPLNVDKRRRDKVTEGKVEDPVR